MKKTIIKVSRVLVLSLLVSTPLTMMAQQQPKIVNLRAYDQTGINVFEDTKNDTAVFDGLKVRFGAGFTQQFQNLKHENPNALKNDVGDFTTSTSGNKLKVIRAGFQTAQANLNMDVQ